ncbi:MAG TPA: dockerin type I domain-containing protein [Tepidisphaeraceae bacterium]|nr:dockerin type I domain-containing protein [Tepidisphaeraceae bacterium]
MTDDSENQSSDDFELPPSLRDKLNAAHEAPTVPCELSARLLASAKASYVIRGRRRRIMRWSALIGLAAAIIILSILFLLPNHSSNQHLAQIGDVNHDGRVDILDAYVVAKAISTGGNLDPAWDVNHDGVVDQKDVDWIAAAAVNVTGNPTGASPQ